MVALGNRLSWPGESNSSEDVRFLFSPLTTPPLWPPKREYNAVSAIADEIWQYRMGGNLTIFNKDHDTAEEGRSQVRQKQSSCSQAYGFATITMYSWWRFGEPAYRSEIYFFFRGGGQSRI